MMVYRSGLLATPPLPCEPPLQQRRKPGFMIGAQVNPEREVNLGARLGRTTRTAARGAAAMLLALAAMLALAAAASAKKSTVLIVSQTKSGAGYYSTVQAAVNASKKHDWILIEPGVYAEEVKVSKKHGGIFIRGMNRNTVIMDGENKSVEGGRNGIEVQRANDVWIENLTVRNFDQGPNGGGGNEIWWNGGADSEKVRAKGWWGAYLTAYDTGLKGAYGIFTNNETEGEWNNIYASGFNDSGMYLGACPECNAVINKATMEFSALGYSGSNSGGKLIIEHSTFRHNTTGVAPNSENPGDGPPPQNGACQHSKPLKHHKGKLPEFTTTEFEHCTIIKEDLITENSDLHTPGSGSAAGAPWGAGVELPGDYGDLVENNTITNNASDGVLAFEFPNPFPITKSTIFFQDAGNKVAKNKFSGNGKLAKFPLYEGDVAFEGGAFGTKTSTNDCLTANEFTDIVFPAEIEKTWGCQNKTTPNPTPNSSEWGGFIEYLTTLQGESEKRVQEPQVAPPAQETMPNPCERVPNNPLCEGGKPR
jgi:hypothetical protein